MPIKITSVCADMNRSNQQRKWEIFSNFGSYGIYIIPNSAEIFLKKTCESAVKKLFED